MSDDRYPDDEPEPKIDLSERFPEMRPVTRVPSLSTVNGIGTAMMGSRDLDEESGTYVKTRCFTFLFVPLVAISAYRVFDAPGGGWYFLGKVPLSVFARTWNKVLLLLALGCAGAGGWFAYTSTEDYKAGAAIARADRLAADGKGGEAAGVYRDVMLGKSGKAGEAKQKLVGLLDAPPSDLTQAAGLFDVALDLHRREQLGVEDLFGRAVDLMKKHEEGDPAGALALLEVVAPLAPKPADQLAQRRRLLERLVEKSPDDVDLVSRLGVVCDQLGDDKRCVALLQPLEDRLGDREQFRRGADNLDRAVALRPGDSILLGNAAGVLMETVARDMVGDAIDLKAIKRSADLGLMSYLYADQAGKERFLVRLRSHPGLAKARGYYDRLLVLAPKRASNYGAVAWICETLRDLDGLRTLTRRLKEAQLDLEQYRRETLDFYAAKDDDKRRDEWKKAEARQREVMPAARKAGGATLAVAASSLSTSLMGAATYGLPVDADEVVKLAEEADAAAPSSATKAARIEALCFRAHRALERDDKGYRELAKRVRRSLGHQALGWVLTQSGALRDRALANADLKRALTLKLAQEKAFPASPSVMTWAYLSAAYPKDAAELAKRVRADEAGTLRQAVSRAQTPLSGPNAMEAYYRLLLNDKPKEAEATLREEAKKGIPLPAASN